MCVYMTINSITSYPKLILGIGLAITFGVTVVLGFVSMDQSFAGGGCTSCHHNN
jgi:hypothetical protein